MSFEQIFPPYTNLPKTQLSAGNLSLLAGGKLHIEGRASQPLKSAEIKLQGAGPNVEMKIGPDGKAISAELPIPAKDLGGFSIVLQNTDGMFSQDNAFYKVEVVPDKPPEVTYAPGQPELETFVATAHPRLRFEAHDDFQVKQVFLCLEADNGEVDEAAPDTSKIIKVPIEVPQPAGSLVFDFDWKNPGASAPWKEGSKFNYWIEAVDNNNVTGPGVGKSPVRKWEVVTLEAKRAEWPSSCASTPSPSKSLSRTQQELRESVGELIKKEGQK